MILLLWDGANDFVVDAVLGVQFLFLQLSPLWQCEVHSISFFLQGHLWVLQPAVYLSLFFENALHCVLSFEASQSDTQVEFCHPFTDRQKFPSNNPRSQAEQHLFNTPPHLTCTAKGTWHKSFQLYLYNYARQSIWVGGSLINVRNSHSNKISYMKYFNFVLKVILPSSPWHFLNIVYMHSGEQTSASLW